MEIGELLNDLHATKDTCDDIIGKEQMSQIKALHMKVNALKSILKQKDAQIQKLQKQTNEIEDYINHVVVGIQKNPNASSEMIEIINEISEEDNIAIKTRSTVDLLLRMISHPAINVKQVNRLRSQLFGHVELLTRLTEMPEFQYLFLVSDQTGNTFLKDQTKEILLEQARSTSALLDKMESGDYENPSFGNIYDLIGHEIDPDDRVIKLQQCLSNEDFDSTEVRDLLVQEAAISSSLMKYNENLRSQLERTEISRSKLEQRRTMQESEYDQKAAEVYEKLCEALGRQNKEFTRYGFLNTAADLADDFIEGKKLAGIKEAGFLRYVKDTGKTIKNMDAQIKQTRRLVARQTQMLAQKQQTNDSEWSEWARCLYTGIMGFGAKPKDDFDARLAIEEASLTAVGSSRIQKLQRGFQ